MTKKNTYRQIDIMGIVNVTDDSYFASSRCLRPDGEADIGGTVEKVGNMLDGGATIIDIGACSTRPGSEPAGKEEEWRRLSQVLGAVRNEFPEAAISVDTWRSGIVERAYNLIGSFIVNDISSGEDDPEMLGTVGRLGLTYIAMHKRGTPKTMQSLCHYKDVTGDVLQYFRQFAEKAAAAGIRDWIVDPGFGFAKTVDQNYQMMRELEKFSEPISGTVHKVLVGISRKSMIYKLFDITPEESLAQTQVLHLAALQNGADILRVHDVAEAARTVELYRRLNQTGKFSAL